MSPLARGRLYIVIAAVLWSMSGMLTRLLQKDTPLGLHEPQLEPMHLAVFRSLFAGLFFLPFVRFGQVRFRPPMLAMVLCFAAMNALFLTAMSMGKAANAILLQNTAPIWVYLFCVFILKEKSDNRSLQSILIGMVGMSAIIFGGLQGDFERQLPVMAMAIGSAMTYGAVILFLRLLRGESPEWLVMLNHLGAAICLATAMFIILGGERWLAWITTPTTKQLLFLVGFGVVQMGLPYWLFAKGLRTVGPQEAGIITLLEPLLNPIWAYMVDPANEKPTAATMIGGGILMVALVWRYWPRRSEA